MIVQTGGDAMAAAREGDPCPKCGTKLSSVLCAPCYGTGRSGKRACKNCGGSGVKIGCPNFRAHKLWPLIRKRVVPQSSAERAKPAWWSRRTTIFWTSASTRFVAKSDLPPLSATICTRPKSLTYPWGLRTNSASTGSQGRASARFNAVSGLPRRSRLHQRGRSSTRKRGSEFAAI